MKRKLLALGLGQSNFLSFLYGAVTKQEPGFGVGAPYLQTFGKSKAGSDLFENGSFRKPHLFHWLAATLKSTGSRHVYATFFFILCVEGKLLKALHFLRSHLGKRAFFLANGDFRSYDVFHFHFMQYSYVQEVFFIPRNKKVVCSFWGSDLLRTSDILNFYLVRKALHRADAITCQSLELREIILSKFGRSLLPKMHVVMFPIEEAIYRRIRDLSHDTNRIAAFCGSTYSSSKINIVVGHSGSRFNNHLRIIEALADFPLADNVHLVVTLSYAITPGERAAYRPQLEAALDKTGCSFAFQEDVLSDDELALSRLVTGIFLHAPASDALSSTMLEMLYAGSVVVTGSWLPYKTFRNAGLHYHEVSDFASLGASVAAIVTHFEAERLRATTNRQAIEAGFSNDELVSKWLQVFS
ncbi:MAG TPA: hypothetical protein VK183_04090 [Flavobacterium sp.]|nr:hypothetical protein [Flavobacterium sp.]